MPSATTAPTRTQCGACGSPTTSGTTLCRTDTAYLRDELAWVADRALAEDVLTTLVRADRAGPQRVRGGSGRPLPWSEPAATALRRLEDALALWWARLHPAEVLPPSLAVRAADVRRALPALRCHPEAADAYAELTEAIHGARVVVDTPAESSRFDVGPCPEDVAAADGEFTACPGTVRAFIGAGDAPSFMRCSFPACGRTWTTSEWLRAGRRILARMGRVVA